MKKYDVIVIGGGPSGICAALSAAKHGQKVLILEKDNSLGGAMSNMLVQPFMDYWTGENNFLLVQGLFTEIIDRYISIKKELDGENATFCHKPLTYFNEEYMKITLMKMAKELGIEVLYHALFLSADCANDQITKITAVVNNTLLDFSAKVYIDCSGNAELAYKAGFPTTLGREKDNLCQPMTLFFRVGQVDTRTLNSIYINPAVSSAPNKLNTLYLQAKERGEIHNPRENVLIFDTVHPNVIQFNTTRVVKLNPTDPYDLSKAEEQAREQVYEMFRFLKTKVPGFEYATLLSTASHIGIRESRMIVGEYTLNDQDVLDCKKFNDGITACNYDIDIHNPEGTGTTIHHFAPNTYYTIPYRCLIPKNSKNLIVAGRCISATHQAQASCRVIPFAMALGQAAGVGAFVANKNNTTVKDADINEILTTLRKDGAFIEKDLPNN